MVVNLELQTVQQPVDGLDCRPVQSPHVEPEQLRPAVAAHDARDMSLGHSKCLAGFQPLARPSASLGTFRTIHMARREMPCPRGPRCPGSWWSHPTLRQKPSLPDRRVLDGAPLTERRV